MPPANSTVPAQASATKSGHAHQFSVNMDIATGGPRRKEPSPVAGIARRKAGLVRFVAR